ncbi:MAG: RNA polymerase sigma factor [Candidatus Omnitrophica bacterium]|nr:RNA polymerase sigma factor [Candidatus Omnitrophota bacterium]
MEDSPSPENLAEKSNEELMRLSRQDVKGAYDIIYARLYGKFVNVAWKILRNTADAENAAQEALIAGYIKRGKFLFLSKTETWLTRILINKAKDIIRKNGGKKPAEEKIGEAVDDTKEIERGEILDPGIDNRAAGNDSQADKKTRMMLMFLEECIKKLPEEEKINLELRELNNIAFKEIAKITKEKFGYSSLGTIVNRIASAKKKVKNCIEKKLSSFKNIFEK